MATARRHKTKTGTGAITLAGSSKMVTEFFEYSLNSILYQRGIYPPDDFKMVKKYGLTLCVTSDDTLERYIQTVMGQVNQWILTGNLSRLVMAIKSKDTRETLERWQFDIHVEEPAGRVEGKENSAPEGSAPKPAKPEKTTEQIQKDIQDIIRQITSSVTFLPSVDEKCTFNIIVYTEKDAVVPDEWQNADPHMIAGNAEQVKLRSFNTSVHKVDGLVAYRLGDVL